MNTNSNFSYNPGDPVAEAILNIYNRIKNNFSAEFDGNFLFNFNIFESFRQNEISNFGPVIRIDKFLNPFYLVFAEVQYKIGSGRYVSNIQTDYQVWGVVNLKNDYGHILIKPETLLDKIHELINPIELDFEDDKEFSEKYYVVTNDKLKAALRLTITFRNYIKEINAKDFIIEIIGNELIIGNKKIFDKESGIEFANFLNNVSGLF